MGIKEARQKANLTQKEFAEKFEIPLDTVKHWDSGRRETPKWAEKLLVEKLEEIIKERENIMTKFELKKNTREIIGHKNRGLVQPGCTANQNDSEPELIMTFDNSHDALEELKKYESNIHVGSCAVGTLYTVEEYYVEENDYDEDGEWVSGGDVWDYSKMDLSKIED